VITEALCEALRFWIQRRVADSESIRLDGGCLATSSIRILVVDDFEPLRQEICSILQTRPELRVVAEVGDGLEAVQKAQELKPDLILLDIGLPTLNGLQAAKRIRQVAPDAAIIFVTQQRDKDLVKAALSTGARGYVLKTDAGRELLPAVDAVLRGDHFVSPGVSGKR
jgi:DNA-binding NarL/FixJ family response regulator